MESERLNGTGNRVRQDQRDIGFVVYAGVLLFEPGSGMRCCCCRMSGGIVGFSAAAVPGGASGSAGTRGRYSGPIWPQAVNAAVAATALQIRIRRCK